jgi:hypothetical protein
MRTLHFTIERLEFVGSGKFMITGRNCRDELRKGDRLRVQDQSATQSVAEFCVDEITWYNKTVEAIDHGHTAGLFFTNDLARHVRLGDDLHGQSES